MLSLRFSIRRSSDFGIHALGQGEQTCSLAGRSHFGVVSCYCCRRRHQKRTDLKSRTSNWSPRDPRRTESGQNGIGGYWADKGCVVCSSERAFRIDPKHPLRHGGAQHQARREEISSGKSQGRVALPSASERASAGEEGTEEDRYVVANMDHAARCWITTPR
jgi:hypothetical protein